MILPILLIRNMSISVQNFAQRGIGETLRTDIYKVTASNVLEGITTAPRHVCFQHI